MSDELHRELQQHASSLRGLARDLLRDSHAAEDCTQQTLSQAWTARKTLKPGPMGGWLQRALTNSTRQWRRTERRRLAHESAHLLASGAQTQPSPAETLARREALQTVTNAVLQLEEPYQTAVFLRYFEDLPPRVIAHRTQSNVGTVKSRLARGLAMLRQRLSQANADGDWRTGLAVTLGLPLGTVLLPVTTGVLLMKTSLKVTLVAAALCIGGLYLIGGPDTVPPSTATAGDKKVETIQASHADPATPGSPVDRVAAAAPTSEQPQLTHPYELELAVHVVDEHGLPVAGFKPELALLGGALRNSREATDEHGNLIMRWPSRLLMADLEIKDPRGHRRRISMRHGDRTNVTLLRRGPRTFSISFRGTNEIRLISHDLTAQLLAGSATSHQMQSGLHPHAVFSEEGLVSVAPKPEVDPAAIGSIENNFILGQMVSYTGDSFTVNSIDSQFVGLGGKEERPSNCTIQGIVYDTAGQPARDIPVVLLGKSPQPLHRTKTNKLGEFRFENLVANTFQVRAGGTDAGLATVPVRVDSGTYAQNLQLQRESCIRGSLQDQADKPVEQAVIEWLSDDGMWADRTKTDQDGTFLLANLPNKPGQLFAWHKDQKWPLPIAQANGVLPDSGAVNLTCNLEQSSAIRMQPQAPDGCDLSQLRLRVRQVDTGFSRGISVPRVSTKTKDKSGVEHTASTRNPHMPWQLKALPAGFYDVEMWLPGCGSRNLGRHWLDGKVDADLGTVALARPGLVHFEVPVTKMPDDLKVEICQLREPFDVRIESLHTLANDVRLAEGDYVLASQRGTEPPRFQVFAVKSDATTVLPVPW